MIDILHGVVVQGVAGRRSEYRPIVSQLVDSTDPLTVADAIIHAVGASTLYVADLDRILGVVTTKADYTDWASQLGVTIWADTGNHGTETANARSIISTESCRLTDVHCGAIVSLDLRNGAFVGDWRQWAMRSPTDFVGFIQATRDVADTLIVLDVAAVGTGGGVPTLALCRLAKALAPGLTVATGGGIRDWGEVEQLSDVDAVLVSSLLHRRTPPSPGRGA